MENNKIKNYNPTNRVWSGLIILVIGLVFFLRNFGVDLPHWLISWPMFLIVIGLFIGFKRNFCGGGWLIMVVIGTYFTLMDIGDFSFNKFFFPLAFIGLGLFFIFKPKRNKTLKDNYNNNPGSAPDISNPQVGASEPLVGNGKIEDNDVIDSVNVFGGSHQKVYSKNFKGGDVIAIFGGCELNLTQSDFQDTIVIDVVAIFGGVKIIIPPTWVVKSEVVAIFGGMDDKRAISPLGDESRKVIIIKGVALFGGVEVRNF